MFRPSSTGSSLLELYHHLLGSEKDNEPIKPHQTRWQDIGTSIGDRVQFWILLATQNLDKPLFKFDTIEKQWGKVPYFEEFSTRFKEFEVDNQKFKIGGSCDGVMVYHDTETGKDIRIGLEVKSKQTTYSRTSNYSMKNADTKHIKQVTSYSLLFDVDYYIILYVNCSKKSWSLEDYDKYPDIKAFGIYITDNMKEEVLNKFSTVCKLAERKEHPKVDLHSWLFNPYKNVISSSLTDGDINELKAISKGNKMLESSLADIITRRGLKEGV